MEAALRAHGVAVRELNVVLNELHASYRQFPLQFDESMLGEFATLFKKIAYFAVSAHAPQVRVQVTSKFDAWEWAKRHARMYLGALPEASFGRRGVIGGMANASDSALAAMGRVEYALQWPSYLRAEFLSLWQELPACRMAIFGWDLEPSRGGSP